MRARKKKRNNQLLLFLPALALVGIFYYFLFFPGEFLSAEIEKSYPLTANIYQAWDIPESLAQRLAKWDILVLDMEAQITSRMTIERIRQLNPKIIILAYITPQEIKNDAGNCDSRMRCRLLAGINERWFLTRPGGERMSYWPGTTMLNVADNSPEVNGIRLNQYIAGFAVNEILSTGLWDGIFFDNAWKDLTWFSGNNVDLDKDGLADNDINTHWREGMRVIYNETRRLVGNRYILVGNGVNDVYKNNLNGMLHENFPSSGWGETMRIYSSNQTGAFQPRINMINANTGNKGSQSYYNDMRYGLASALLLDGYYSFDYGDKEHGQTWWYDEYDINLGTPSGAAKSQNNKPQFTEDIWRRDFEHGTAIVNATNAAQTIDLGGEYEKIKGNQDPSVNDGTITDRVSVNGRDGVILMKTFQTIDNTVFTNGSFLRFYNIRGQRVRNGFFAFEPVLAGGARVYFADLNGDGAKEKIIANGPKLEIFNSRGEHWFEGYPLGDYNGDINIAVGKLSVAGANIIVISGGGKIAIYTYYGAAIKEDFFPFGKKYRGDISVAVRNAAPGSNGEIAVSAAGNFIKSELFLFDNFLQKNKNKYAPFGKNAKIPIIIAAGDVNGDKIDELISAADVAGKSVVKILSPKGVKISEFIVAPVFGSKIFTIGIADVNFDGVGEIVIGSN